MDYKKDEIKNYIFDNISNYNWNEIIKLYKDGDLHHELFNRDYYLIGYYACERWLLDGKLNQTFEVINYIKEYEQNNFGECYTDLSSSEKVVNMYASIIGEELLSELSLLELYKHYKRY